MCDYEFADGCEHITITATMPGKKQIQIDGNSERAFQLHILSLNPVRNYNRFIANECICDVVCTRVCVSFTMMTFTIVTIAVVGGAGGGGRMHACSFFNDLNIST